MQVFKRVFQWYERLNKEPVDKLDSLMLASCELKTGQCDIEGCVKRGESDVQCPTKAVSVISLQSVKEELAAKNAQPGAKTLDRHVMIQQIKAALDQIEKHTDIDDEGFFESSLARLHFMTFRLKAIMADRIKRAHQHGQPGRTGSS